MKIYRVFANVYPMVGNSNLGNAIGAFVNIYFPETYLKNWEGEIKAFLLYYQYGLISFDEGPLVTSDNEDLNDVEQEAFDDSKRSGFPRYGTFHSYLSEGDA